MHTVKPARRLVTYALILLTTAAACLLALKILSDIGIRFRSSTTLIEQLVEKAGIDASQAEPVSVSGPDGNMPEIVIWSAPVAFSPDSPAASRMIAALTTACRDLGLGPIRESLRIHYPDAICDGAHAGYDVTVSATVRTREEDGRTHLTIETHAL